MNVQESMAFRDRVSRNNENHKIGFGQVGVITTWMTTVSSELINWMHSSECAGKYGVSGQGVPKQRNSISSGYIREVRSAVSGLPGWN